MLSTMLSTILCCAFLLYCFYRYLRYDFDYWLKRNVPYDRPITLFGSIIDVMLMRKSLSQYFDDLYHKYPDSRFVGFYKLGTPCLLLRNPEDIVEALAHNADFFGRNEVNINTDVDPIAAKVPFFLYGQKWRTSRSMFTPMLSPSKLKHVTPQLVQATKKMLEFLEDRKVCEARDLSMRYVADASALSAFGVYGESFERDDAFFKKFGQQVLAVTGFQAFKIMSLMSAPLLAKWLRFKFMPDSAIRYLSKTISTALKHREENNINNNDFLDTIVAMKRDSFTDVDVLAWSFAFFSESNVSNQESYVLYCLAKNSMVQEKLKIEIEEVLIKYNEEITYDAVQDMPYLDNVISETLRLYPSFQMNLKRCTGYYEFPLKDSEKEIIAIEPGMSIAVCVIGMHRDEKYFEDAKEFIPERFSDNQRKFVNEAYMPFGLGKRTCPGMKFAFIQLKISTVAIIRNFKVTVNEKTVEPLELDPHQQALAIPKSGIWLNFTKRN